MVSLKIMAHCATCCRALIFKVIITKLFIFKEKKASTTKQINIVINKTNNAQLHLFSTHNLHLGRIQPGV
ncbi:MAG: hypothetical protein AB9Q18_12385, partial [Candidatus Reddybacter sp.]